LTLLKNPKNKSIKLLSDPLQDHCSFKENYPYWQGTIVAIDLCLTENKAFEEVLKVIREFYEMKRKEKIKQVYRRPRFI